MALCCTKAVFVKGQVFAQLTQSMTSGGYLVWYECQLFWNMEEHRAKHKVGAQITIKWEKEGAYGIFTGSVMPLLVRIHFQKWPFNQTRMDDSSLQPLFNLWKITQIFPNVDFITEKVKFQS